MYLYSNFQDLEDKIGANVDASELKTEREST